MSLSEEAKRAIDEEIQVVEQTYQSLKNQREKSSSKYLIEKERARELTTEIVLSTRAEDKAQLASDEAVAHSLRDKKVSDSAVLDSLIERPYFARIVLEERSSGTPRKIEYKIGHHANPDCRIIDWRKAPLSKLYYEYKEGDEYAEEIQGQDKEGKVLLRNTVETQRNVLKSLVSGAGSYRNTGKEWVTVADAGSRARLGTTSNELPSILSLITAEQFRTITEEADTAVIIQGIAGSGKTTVALHRLAWLLHSDNSDLKADKAVVLVKNNSLRTYISQTLPSMNVIGVKILTFSEWAFNNLNSIYTFFGRAGLKRSPKDPSASTMRLKNSLALLKSIEDYVEAEIDNLMIRLDKDLAWDDLPSGLKVVFESLKNSEATLAPLALLQSLKSAFSDAIKKVAGSHPKGPGIYQALFKLDQFILEHSNFSITLKQVLSNYQLVLGNDETKLLDKEMINAYLGDLENSLKDGEICLGDEVILLRIAQMKLGGFIDSTGKALRYGHIVLDEAQDFSAIYFSIVMNSVQSQNQLTIVGDTAQGLDPDSSFPGWSKLRAYWGIDEEASKFVTLSVSHRSTLPIMKLADYVLGEQRTSTGRTGKPPRWVKCKSERSALPRILEWLNEVRKRFPTTLTAVICSNRQEAKDALSLLEPTFGNSIRLGDSDAFTFEAGIVVSDVKSLKGLEFNSLLLWNPSESGYPDTTLGRNSLYTAITRAESFLFIASWGKPSTLLPRIDSQLVRGEDYTQE